MDENSRYRDLFFEETDEYLQNLNECILQLEKNPEDKNVLDEIFRAAHTLKGMAATMGYKTMTDLTHSMESVLELFRIGKNSIDSDIISLIFRCLDKLSEIVEDLRIENYVEFDIDDLLMELSNVSKGDKEESKVINQVPQTNGISDTDNMVILNAKEKDYYAYYIVVKLDKNCMLKGARSYLVINKLEKDGEILSSDPTAQELEEGDFEDSFTLIYISKLTKEEIKDTIEGIAEIEDVSIEEIYSEDTIEDEMVVVEQSLEGDLIKDDQKNEIKASNHHFNQSIRVDINKLDSFMNLVSELVIYRTRLEDLNSTGKSNEITEPLEHVARITSQLQDLVLKIRMEPVNVVFNRFPRMIRDLSNELGKEMELVIEGEETELDRTVVSEIGEPLIHLMRNAADHGIEAVGDRQALGKSKVGLIKLSAYQEGNRVVITVSDDGKGIDPNLILESANRKGIDTQSLSDRDLVQLIFNQGFSTAKNVTNVSGRGVGMDVVRQKITSLGGSIEVVSEINKGTSFIIKLPLTLSIIQALMVKIGAETFAIPLGIIEKVNKAEKGQIFESHNGELYIYRKKTIPVIRINDKLAIPPTEGNKHIIVILLGDQHYGVVVDDLSGQQEIVIKKLTGILSKMPEYLGATILGNGDITLILDLGNLCSERKVEKVG